MNTLTILAALLAATSSEEPGAIAPVHETIAVTAHRDEQKLDEVTSTISLLGHDDISKLSSEVKS